jgi:hypothetical protein
MSERIDEVHLLEIMETVEQDGEIRVYAPESGSVADREAKILREKGRKVRLWTERVRRG